MQGREEAVGQCVPNGASPGGCGAHQPCPGSWRGGWGRAKGLASPWRVAWLFPSACLLGQAPLPPHPHPPQALALRTVWMVVPAGLGGGQCAGSRGDGPAFGLCPPLLPGVGNEGGRGMPPAPPPTPSALLRLPTTCSGDCPGTVVLFLTLSLVVSKLIRLGIYLQRLAQPS